MHSKSDKIYFYWLHEKSHKTNPNCGWSYIDSPVWIKNEKVTINPTDNKDNKFFLYAVTVVLNNEEIGKHAERIMKIKSFINKKSLLKYVKQKLSFFVM